MSATVRFLMSSGLWLAVSGIRNYFMHLTGCGGIVAVLGLSPKVGGEEETGATQHRGLEALRPVGKQFCSSLLTKLCPLLLKHIWSSHSRGCDRLLTGTHFVVV